MINRVTGEVDFRGGLRIVPHCPAQSLGAASETARKVRSQKLSAEGWTRHVLGTHVSEHGAFEVEALSGDDDCIRVVLLSHQHSYYEPGTAGDADRRVFHEGVVSSDLGGQREFTWGEVLCRLESRANKDWLVIAYNGDPRVSLPVKDLLIRLHARESTPDDKI